MFATTETGSGSMERPHSSNVCAELQSCSIIGILLGILLGLLGLFVSGLDIWFAIALASSIVTATILLLGLKVIHYKVQQKYSNRMKWTTPILIGCQDFLLSCTMLQMTHLLLSIWPVDTVDSDI